MEIREALLSDIPEIVGLLKQSLGESLMPKSEQFWRWKHLENPFGPSPVLIAKEDNAIVGVRAFLNWQFENGERTYRAVRAVDTATHPNYQGKGIFKKLTLQLAEKCQAEGVDLVFNTPNTSSRPGYLKMGWIDAGRLPISIYPLSVGRMLKAGAIKSCRPINTPKNIQAIVSETSEAIFQNPVSRKDRFISTAYGSDYLKWRYVDVPVAEYCGFSLKEAYFSMFVIGRLKQTRFGNEFRITDHFVIGSPGKSWRKQFLQFVKDCGGDYVTSSKVAAKNLKLGFTLNKGPITTLRSLSLTDLASFKGFSYWKPSLGDLELF